MGESPGATLLGPSRVAITDLAGEVLAQTRRDIPIAEGPEPVLGWLESAFDSLLAEIGRDRANVRGVGVGLPGPVEFATGRPVNPPIMPGWDRYPVGERLADRYGVPALVDNDVNIMAVGEHWSTWRDQAFISASSAVRSTTPPACSARRSW